MAISSPSVTLSVGVNEARIIRDIQAAFSRAEQTIKFNPNFNSRIINSGLGSMSRSANEFGKSLQAAEARVLAFGVVAGQIFLFTRGMRDLVRTTIEVEKSLTDINVILNLSSKSLSRFSDDLFKVAKNTGQTFSVVAEAATEFSRQGLGVEETLKRTRDALILTRLSGLDVVSSTEAITAALNSFSDAVLNSTQLVNKFAKVDASFAVSSADLAEGIKRVGSAAQDAGVDINQLIALITSAQQSTARGGSVIGNSLKTIFQRLSRRDTLSSLQGFGVQTEDESGQLLPATEVLKNLSSIYKTLDPLQKNTITQLAAGVYQANIFKAVLNDLSKNELSVYEKALRASNSATDEAIDRNKELNKTLSALINESLNNLIRVSSDIGNKSIGGPLRKVLGGFNKAAESGALEAGAGALGSILSGPGLVIGLGLAVNLMYRFISFTSTALRSVLTINSEYGAMAGILDRRISQLNIIRGIETDIAKIVTAQASGRLAGVQGGVIDRNRNFVPQYGLAERLGFAPTTIQGRQPYRMAAPTPGMNNLNQLSQRQSGRANRLMEEFLRTASDPRVNMGSAYAGLYRNFGRVSNNPNAMAEFQNLARRNVADQRAFTANQQRIATLYPQAQNVFSGRAARRELRGLDRDVYDQTNLTRGNRLQSTFLGASVGAALLGSGVNSMITGEGRGSRNARGVVSALTEGVSIGGGAGVMAGMVGGPQVGLAVGVITALATTGTKLYDVFKNWNDILPELKAKMEGVTEAFATVSDVTANIQQILEKENKLVSGVGKATPEAFMDLQAQKLGLISKLPASQRGDILGALASGDQETISKMIDKITGRADKRVGVLKAANALGSYSKATGDGRSDIITQVTSQLLGMDVDGENVLKALSKEGTDINGIGGSVRRNPGDAVRNILNRANADVSTQEIQDALAKLSQSEYKEFNDAVVFNINKMIRAFRLATAQVDKITGGKENPLKEMMDRLGVMEQGVLGSKGFARASNINNIVQTGISNIGANRMENGVGIMDFLNSPNARRSLQNQGMIQSTRAMNNAESQIRANATSLISGFGDTSIIESMRAGILKGGKNYATTNQMGVLDKLTLGQNALGVRASKGLPLGLESEIANVRAVKDEFDTKFSKFDDDLTKSIRKYISDYLEQLNDALGKENEIKTGLDAEIEDIKGRYEDFIEKLSATSNKNILRALGMGGLTSSEAVDKILERSSMTGGPTSLKGAMGDAGSLFTAEMTYTSRDFFNDVKSAGIDTARTLKSEFGDAFKEFVSGTKSASDAFRDFAINIATNLQGKIIDMGVNSLFSSIFGAKGGGAAKAGALLMESFSSGGVVTGGSGTRDDVPAMLTSGEYVINKSAVDRIGKSNLDALNHANIRLGNSYSYNNESSPSSGGFAISKYLSQSALDDDNNPQNQLRNNRESAFVSYIQEKLAYDNQKSAAMSAFEKQRQQQLIGTYISAVIGGVGAGLQGGGMKPTAPGRPNSMGQTFYGYKSMPGFAGGGSVFGGSSPTDNIPAMLMGGEYVVNKSAVDRIGVGTLNRMNRGFASGGLVGSSGSSGSIYSGSDVLDLLNKLISINENIEKSITDNPVKKSSTPGVNNETGGSNINTTINITISSAGDVKSDSKTASQSKEKNGQEMDQEKARQLGDTLRAIAVQEIITQLRPGGLISGR